MINPKNILQFCALGFFLIFTQPSHAFGWRMVNAKIRHDFPKVERMSTAELAAWLNDATRPAPLLLDVRTQAEYEVSHLRDALQVEPGASAIALRAAKNQPIVTYCSVGYRSGAFAEKLRAAGYAQVKNLEGSIFQWANENRPLYHGGAKAEKVHPYNRIWGLLLQRKYRAEIAPAETKG